MDEQEYALGELDRRMGNLLRFGTVVAVDTSTENGLAKVDIGDLVTDWIIWLTPSAGDDRVWFAPSIGEQVAVFSPGDPSQGCIVGSAFQNAFPANGNNAKDRRITFKDGSVVEFDREASALNVQVNPAGSIRLNIGGTTLLLQDAQTTLTTPALIVDSPVSTFTGAVNVGGLLTFSAGITGSGGSGYSMSITGDVSFTGLLSNNGKSVGSALRVTGVQAGGDTSGTPV